MADLRAQLQDGLTNSYVLERELGRGGMATVFLAHDLKHDRPVALKVLNAELAATLGPDRFQREIRLAARLQHPHILTVLDSGSVGDRLWFTMPYVDGESVRDRLRRERQLPVEDALRITREAAQALQYAHEHGIIHRDIKPENLLLTRDGNTLVADFGIARALTGRGDERLTETGLAVGTPAYMSPEQAAGERALDARTDIYSLAVVLYEMLAGEAPWTGPTAQSILAKRFNEPAPSLRRVRPAVPATVDAAIQRSLAAVPADRVASAAQFAQALEAPVTFPRSRVPRSALTLGLGFLVGLGVLFAWRLGQDRAPAQMAAAGNTLRVAVLPFENLGDSSDAYFADGVSDAVRGKLMGLPTLSVIARASSEPYRRSTKSPHEIGRELGVQYLLTGTVRWAKRSDGTSRVQVSPELLDVATATGKWQQAFDASVSDVFEMQAEIAGQVAQALDVALGAPQQQALAARPTASFAAYDAFLKGEAAAQGLGTVSPVSLRQAIGFYEQAVALDSAFVQAWVQLGRANALLYSNGRPAPATAEASRSAAERAVAIEPDLPEGQLALGDYYALISRDYARAGAAYAAGLAVAPARAELLVGAAQAKQALGKWEESLSHLQRAVTLDPRSVIAARRLTLTLVYLRRYSEALAAADSARARAYADSARQAYEASLAATPDEPQNTVLRGLALAYQGRKAEAIAAGERGLGLAPVSRDANVGPYLQHQLARIYILAGEPDKALDHLEPLLRMPYFLSPGWLRIDPTFDPLRKNPRFQKLTEGT